MSRYYAAIVAFVLAVTLSSSAAFATALTAGENQGTADSFVGTQHWTAGARAGHFEIDIMLGQMPNNAVFGAPFNVVLHVSPKSQVKHVTFKKIAGGYVYSGTTTAATHLTLDIIPPGGGLVRNAVSYTITATGSLDFGGSAGSDPIVGTYQGMLTGIGAAKFQPGGKVVTTQGDTGTWSLFDAGTHLYVVTIGQNRWTVKNVPGQGLLDSGNGNIIFQAVH